MSTIKNNKPKKLNNRNRRVRKSPPRTLSEQGIDELTGPQLVDEARTSVLGATAIVTSDPGSRNMFGQPTQGPGTRVPVSQSAPTSPVAANSNTVPPPPNATVVVCVLAGTGRADLWLRNNRGQTPLDLCPADQPLRRALIKCCDAAARVRSAQAAAGVTSETGTLLPNAAERWPQQSKSQLHKMPTLDYSIKASSHDAYHTPSIAGRAGFVKECNKLVTTYKAVDSVQARTGVDDESHGHSHSLLSTVSSQESETSISAISTSVATINSDNIKGNTNSIDNCDTNPGHIDENDIASMSGSNNITMTDNRYLR